MSVKNIINYINKRTDLYQEVLGEAKKIVNQINEESKYPFDIYGDEPYINIKIDGLDKKVVINPVKVQAIAQIANSTISEAIIVLIEEEIRFDQEQV